MLKTDRFFANRILSVILTLILTFSACFIGAGIKATAAEVTATSSHTVYSNDFTDPETLDDFIWAAEGNASHTAFTASIADGSMTFNNTNGSGSYLHGMRFLPDKKYTEQRVELTFDAQKGLKPCLWARVSQDTAGDSKSCYGYYVLFSCNADGSVNLNVSKRMGTANADIGSIKCSGAITVGQEYRMEMVVQGTNPTLISVSLYTKYKDIEDAVIAHNTFVDNEARLQSAGSAGLSAARTVAVTATSVSVKSFEFTSTDNVTGRYYVEEGSVGTKTFGQVVVLDPTKKYVFAAHSADNGLMTTSSGVTAENVNPLWIEYFNTGNSGTRALISNENLSSNREESKAVSAGIEYNEYFTVFYNEFDLSTVTDKKIETGLGDKTRVIVGFRCDGKSSTTGRFSHFTLYAADDENKTNLLVNPDFKMGLYGWNDAAGSYMNYTQMKESVGTATNGHITLSNALTEYEYYKTFKNSGFTVMQGDASRDGAVDIRDLVATKKLAIGIVDEYRVAVDFDSNNFIAASDLRQLRRKILGVAVNDEQEGEDVMVKAEKIARIGYRPYDPSTPPEQSIASYRMAYENGYKILLCDVRTTADGYFVALHDKTINSYATDSEGRRINGDTPINISDITLAQADEYDFGVYRGEQYKGTKIMRVAEFVALCKELNVRPHLELKETFSEKKLDELIELIEEYGFADSIMINGQNADNLRYIADKLPNAALGTWVLKITDSLINQIATYGENNPKFIYVSNGGETSITYANYLKCLEKGIDIAYTEIKTEADLEAFKALGALKYCKYVATRYDLY